MQFENVVFGYEKGRPVLKELSLTVPAGKSVALIGASGAGKSTILNLVPRFYDPDSGRVSLFGTDLKELSLQEVRGEISYLFQEPLLVHGTISENIAYANPEATARQIEAAARAANAQPFIEKLPDKYDTIVGEGAARLSVGEKQRLNLARAFLKNSPILLLDEPTSALDAETEALVTDSLELLMKNKTSIIVAHRLSTISNVDVIFILQDGKVIESGSPQELRERDNYYSRLAARSLSQGCRVATPRADE